MKVSELKFKYQQEIERYEDSISKDLANENYKQCYDMKLRKRLIEKFLLDLDNLQQEEITEEWEPVRFTEENIDYWFENDDFPQYQYIHFKGLKLMLMITEISLAVTIFKQDAVWYLKESVEYNRFTVVSTRLPSLYNNHIALRGVYKKYDNSIVVRSFENIDELKEYLLRMLQALEYAEYKLEKEIEK